MNGNTLGHYKGNLDKPMANSIRISPLHKWTMLKKISFLIVLAFLPACSSRPGQQDSGDFDSILRNAVDRNQVPGIVAMAADEKGIIYEGAFGYKKDAIFAIASMTKPVTSVAVMQLVEDGKVDLDTAVATYLPELGKVQVLEGSTLRPPKSTMTVRHLLTHTSGFAYEFINSALHNYVAQGKVPSLLAGGDGFLQSPLFFDPGTRMEYGISVDWLGRLVERITGMSLDEYFREKFFEPLGMQDTYFNVPVEKHPRLAAAFQRTNNGDLVQNPAQPQQPVKFFSGGGGLYSTAADYLTFMQALLGDGRTGNQSILRAETIAEMGRNQIGELTVHIPIPSVMPELLVDKATMPGGIDTFGLGFALNSKALDNGRGVNTMSWLGINNTYFWIDREKKVCAVIMSQMLPCLDLGPLRTVEEFERILYSRLD